MKVEIILSIRWSEEASNEEMADQIYKQLKAECRLNQPDSLPHVLELIARKLQAGAEPALGVFYVPPQTEKNQ